MENARIAALVQHLRAEGSPNIGLEDVTAGHDETAFEAEGAEFLVLTEAEANAATARYVADSIWAFNAEFICAQTGLPWSFAEVIKAAQEKMCEGANEGLSSIVDAMCKSQDQLGETYQEYLAGIDGASEGGLAVFAMAAARADGRGHFLSPYDGEEHEAAVKVDENSEPTDSDESELAWFFIYRTN